VQASFKNKPCNMGFKFVLIPASGSNDIQELDHPEDVLDLTDDSFKTFVENYFTAVGGTVDRTVLLKQLQERTGVDLAAKDLGAKNLDRLLHATSVEIFPAQVPIKDQGYFGVSVYCDDKGIAKGLEENPRMSGLIQACGYHGQIFRGDCFIGRVFDDTEDEWKRIDFSIQDISTDAEWVQNVRKMREKRSAGDMTSFAKSVGAHNPAQITAGAGGDAAAEGETEQYAWRQAGDEVEITFKKDGLVKGDKKAVKVSFGRQKLKVEARGDVLIDAELYAATAADESTWTLSDGVLQVTLTKEEADNWPRLLKGD